MLVQEFLSLSLSLLISISGGYNALKESGKTLISQYEPKTNLAQVINSRPRTNNSQPTTNTLPLPTPRAIVQSL